MVSVFKTNLSGKMDELVLKPILDNSLHGIKWNFDLEDCDRIFRVEGAGIIAEDIVRLFSDQGYKCQELF